MSIIDRKIPYNDDKSQNTIDTSINTILVLSRFCLSNITDSLRYPKVIDKFNIHERRDLRRLWVKSQEIYLNICTIMYLIPDLPNIYILSRIYDVTYEKL